MYAIPSDREQLIAQNPELVDRARRHYDESMECHNFKGHILGTWESAAQ